MFDEAKRMVGSSPALKRRVGSLINNLHVAATASRFKVLEGIVRDDVWFGFIAAADEGDDWTDPAVWRKANPNFAISVKEDDLARKAEKAIALPGAQNASGACT